MPSSCERRATELGLITAAVCLSPEQNYYSSAYTIINTIIAYYRLIKQHSAYWVMWQLLIRIGMNMKGDASVCGRKRWSSCWDEDSWLQILEWGYKVPIWFHILFCYCSVSTVIQTFMNSVLSIFCFCKSSHKVSWWQKWSVYT